MLFNLYFCKHFDRTIELAQNFIMRYSKAEIEELICKQLYKNSWNEHGDDIALKEEMFYVTAERIAAQLCDDSEYDFADDHFEDLAI